MERELKPYVLRRVEDDPTPSPLSLDYAQALNTQQLAAVTAADGPALVIAGAGSGKTRTLVYRVAYLIDKGVDPSAILLLTFTRKSAQEMLTRAGVLIGARSERVFGGTFHSVANALLRQYGRPIGLEPGFTILDRGDAEDLISLLRGQLGLSEKEKRFPRKATVAEIFSKCVNTLQPLDAVVLEEFSHFAEHLEDLEKLRRAFESEKRTRQLLDYDDLLVRLQELLGTEVCQTISNRFRHILVDEYQDTNRLQADLIRKLAATHDHVMVVGDDSQSIYAFRGATFRNIMEFPTLFPGCCMYKLEENYRSTQPILNVANEVIRGAAEKYSKALFTRKLDGPLPALVQAGGENAQSRFVAQKILELREEGIPLDEMAVLFRSSFHSFDLEIELSRRNLPFVKRGGYKFIETAHVKDLLAHLRVIGNPLDTVSWHRALLLVEGVGPKKAQELITSFVSGERAGRHPIETLREASGRSGRALKDLARVLEEGARTPTPAEQVNEIYGYYLPILKEHYDDYPKRMRDLEHLYTMAERYQALDGFLADLALEPPDESVVDVNGLDRDDERLILSTIHSAKGLEWQSVFVIWAVDGRFPSAYSFTTDEQLEEERRLFYVAVTRAKQHLFLTYPINVYDKVTGGILSKPSRFLDDVPSSLLDSWALVEESGFHDRWL